MRLSSYKAFSLLVASSLSVTYSRGFTWPSVRTRHFAHTLLSASSTATSADTGKHDVVKVDLDADRDYPIYIGAEFSLEQAGEMIRKHIKGNRALIVTNDRVGPFWLEKYEKLVREAGGGEVQVDTLVLPDGEAKKTVDVLGMIFDKALDLNLDRKCTFIALGGGVIGDMVGFASAVYQRGVNFIQVPTTVMAMVDSSVGGKTGVNHPKGKNMIGAFNQPQCVFIDTDNLSTLPDREFFSGISEIIKYGLIRDPDFFEWQEKNMEKMLARDPEALRIAIKRSCENKAEVVKADEREGGIRATLNLGHTFGHAIETGSGYGTYLHGEGVAIGTAMAARMSLKLGWIDEDTHKRCIDLLKLANLPIKLPKDTVMTQELFLNLMAVDKKVADGVLRLILLKGPLGSCTFTGEYDRDAMVETIDEFLAEAKE